MAVKMTALAPTPSASVRKTTAVKPGVADNMRTAYRRSRRRSLNMFMLPLSATGSGCVACQRSTMSAGRARAADSICRSQRRVISRYRRGGARQSVFVRSSSRARFLVEIAQVFRQLVDDFRLARQRQRRESFPHVLTEVHVSPDRIDAGDALQRLEQLAPARSLLGQHPPSLTSSACSSGGVAARSFRSTCLRSSRGAPCGRASDRATRRETAAHRRNGRR